MKILYYFIIVILIFSTLLYLKPIQADDANGVKIENIRTLPSSVIVGQTFKISATLVNNSSKPIFVDYGSCEAPFSVTFDTHVLVNETHPICNLSILEQKLNPGENTTATSPSLDLVYKAIQNGTVNATMTFPYKIWNQTIQSNSNEIVSEPFSFVIYGKTRVPTLPLSGNQTIVDVALAIPDLQKWSNDWQFDSMAFMTAKNQPGNWQYAVVYLKASSSSSIIPCDNNNDWFAMVIVDRTTMKVISATYPTMESHNCNYATDGGPGTTSGDVISEIDPPLKQFKSGIAANNAKCEQGLQLVIRVEDSSPACVKPQTAQKLVEHGWGMMPTFALANNILENNCGQFYTVPENSSNYNEIPVLMLKQNSTGCAKITFTENSLFNNTNDCMGCNSQLVKIAEVIRIGKYNYATSGISYGISSSTDDTRMFKITSIPDVVDISKYPVGSNFTAIFIIKPLANATGFYDYSIEKMPCNDYPLAVGYNYDQVNSSDFSKALGLMQNHSCLRGGLYGISSVQVSGMSYVQMKLD